MADPDTRTTVAETLTRYGLAVGFTFVPLDMSRHRGKKPHITVNWRATVTCHGRPVLETDYSAGAGFLPSAKLPANLRDVAAKMEAQSGRVATATPAGTAVLTSKPLPSPDPLDCLACLVSDAGALDYPTFESWASECGLNEDSREAERSYRACLDTALRLRAAVGEAGLTELREAFADW